LRIGATGRILPVEFGLSGGFPLELAKIRLKQGRGICFDFCNLFSKSIN
jgi:hypothetical protein